MSVLLSASMAWPANLPVASPEIERPMMVRTPRVVRHPGPSFKKLDRGSHLRPSDWADVVDNAEESDGRDDSWPGPLAISGRHLDMPSLVPNSIDARPLGSSDTFTSAAPRSPQLRC